LDVASINRIFYSTANNSDDDISLSSIEDNDYSGENYEATKGPNGASIEEDIEDTDKDDAEAKTSVVIAASNESDTACDEQSGVIDLTFDSSKGQRIPALSLSNGHGQNEIQRLSRIAKKFKRQFLQKNAQYKKEYNEKRKLSGRVRQVEEQLLEMEGVMNELERNRGTTELMLNESRLSLHRTTRELDILKSKHSMIENEKTKMDVKLKACRLDYEKELEKARAKSMSEVQQILEEHPKVVEQNRILRQKLQKLNGYSNCSKKSKDISRALREMDQQIRCHNKAASIHAMSKKKSTNRNQTGKQSKNLIKNNQPGKRPSTIKVNSGVYSSLASRLPLAMTQKVKKPSHNAIVRDMLSSSTSQDCNEISDSKKRSSTAPFRNVSATSLNLSQNKRMKSSIAARHSFFQR